MMKKPQLLVELTLIPTEHGGRKSPILSGYRPQFYYNNKDWIAELHFIDTAEVKPGDTVKAHIIFLSPNEHKGKLSSNNHFLIREGQKVVAYGHVIKELWEC
jgi:elongation factor Tu